MTLSHEELFRRYIAAGALGRDAEAYAGLFTEDGVYEAPLLPPGHRLPRRLAGRDAIREGIVAYHREPGPDGTLNLERSAYVLHETADPDVFIVEIDTVFDTAAGQSTTMPLVQIFRIRDGRIAMLRDYFQAP